MEKVMGKRVGIIAAMKQEMQAIKEVMEDIAVNKIYELECYEGRISNADVVLVKCGVGKVNAARTTQILINHYDLSYIINVGSAGSIKDDIHYGDIVIGKYLVQHDFDITAFGHEKGYISNIGVKIESDKKLIARCEKAISQIINPSYKISIGTIASGDIFCTTVKMKNKIREKFNADCVEMEGAAIAQVCYLDKVPFVIIRSISDSPNGNNEIDFNQYLDRASKRCAEFIKILEQEQQ